LSPDELNLVWDQLKLLVKRGEVEVRNPDGTVLRFEEPKIEEPPKEKIESLPPAAPTDLFDEDLDDINGFAPTAIDVTSLKTTKKKKGRKKKKKKDKLSTDSGD
jgi:hypothetical protein